MITLKESLFTTIEKTSSSYISSKFYSTFKVCHSHIHFLLFSDIDSFGTVVSENHRLFLISNKMATVN